MPRLATLGVCLLGGLAVLAALTLPSRAADDPLPSWAEGPAKRQILDFVGRVTAVGGPDYVPPPARVATFDNDGTLWAEKPFYFQLLFALDRVRALAPSHPEWKEMEPFRAVLEDDREALAKLDMEAVTALVGATHSGSTEEEFRSIVRDWIATARHPQLDRPFTELVYAPMLELLELLRQNEFQVWICSGGGIDFLRAWAEQVYGIPPERIIGSAGRSRFEVQDGHAVLVKEAGILRVNDKETKPVGISLHIGRRPILAGGNSDGDLAMLQYTDDGEGPALMLLVHHDDAEREWAYDRDSPVGRLDKALDVAKVRDWTVVSMKSDWSRVYRAEEPAAARR